MTTLTSKLSRFAVLTTVVVGSGFAFFTGSAGPAMALCKKGTPHCIPVTRPDLPKVGGEKIPGSGWVDPDCEYYPGLCGSSEVKGTNLRRHPTGPVTRLPRANRLTAR